MSPFIAYFLPACKRIVRNLEVAEKLIRPLIVNDRSMGDRVEGEAKTLMDWMIENGNEKENRADKMAARQLVLTLASIHTTATAVSHALFDLCAHPELLEPLQTELEACLQGQKVEVGQEHLSRLHLLDSFLVESQRHNPPILRESITIAQTLKLPLKIFKWLHNAW
jgi:cytochrome P450